MPAYADTTDEKRTRRTRGAARSRQGVEAPSPDAAEDTEAAEDSFLAPTGEYVKALRVELETLYQKQDEQIDILREVRELRNRVVLPDEFEIARVEVRDPTIPREIEREVSRLTANEPSLQVKPPPNSGDAGIENATLREHWTEEALRQIFADPEGGPDGRERTVDGMVGDGGGWCKVLYDPHRWDSADSLPLTDDPDWAKTYKQQSEEARKEAGPPFVGINVDVRSIYPVFSGGKLSAVLEVQKRPLLQVFRKYRLRYDDAGNIVPAAVGLPVNATAEMASATVEVLEYWDDTHCLYVIDGGKTKSDEPKDALYELPRIRHGYPGIPYFNCMGRFHGYWRNRKIGKSISEDKRWLSEYLSYLMTVHAQTAARDTLPPGYLEVPDGAAPLVGEDGKPISSIEYKPGKITVGKPGHKLNLLQFPQTSAQLEKHIALIQSWIEKLEMPRVQQTIGADGNGFNTSLVLGELRVDENPLAVSVERMFLKITKFIWKLVEMVDTKVWVGSDEGGWLGLGPDDLKSGVTAKWTLNPERPQAKLVENRYWNERLSNRTAGRRMAVEAQGDNYDEVLLEVAMDDIRNSDEYKAVIKTKVFQKAGRADALAEAIALQRLKLAQAGQIPGMPPGGAAGGAMPAAMGSQQVPDMGNLSVSPNGAGAQLQPQPGTPGPTAGAAVVPTQSGAAGVQSLGA